MPKTPRGKSTSAAQAARNDQVIRVLLLLRELDRLGGADLYELAERYGTSVRTIRRDLDALEAAGFPLLAEGAEDSSRKRWTLDSEKMKSAAKAMDASHYLALRVAMGQVGPVHHQSALFTALEDLGTRIEGAVGAKGRAQLEAIDSCIFSWEKFAWKKAPSDLFWPLVHAITEKRLCTVRYKAPHSKDDGKRFRVLPLRLFVHHGSAYLHAWTPKFKNVLILNLQRLVSVELSDERMEPPPGYSTEALEETAFGVFIGPDIVTYHLRFSAEIAPFIREKIWHPTQKLTELKDGRSELSFRCAKSYEVGSWVASWREGVEVLGPPALVDEMKEYARWMGERYLKTE